MCGILGSAGRRGGGAGLSGREAERWLASLAHRGPDGHALWSAENVLLGHTRLAVRDPQNPGSVQPMVSPCGRFALTYNGELYSDAEERARLEPRVRAATGGRGFHTSCDAETVLWALLLDGTSALDRLRGMYALAFVDLDRRSLVLARDPLGVKPLVWAHTTDGVAFASEPRALTAHPGARRRPDRDMIGAYLVTGRRTLGERTMFEGVRSVEPGSVLRFDLDAPLAQPARLASAARFARSVVAGAAAAAHDRAAAQERAKACEVVVTDALRAHLVSDVPLCGLLSGGLDSAILTGLAVERSPGLATWCSSGVEDGAELGPDPAFARQVAAHLGTRHAEVPVDHNRFLAEWRNHVIHLGTPLSTPNEIAISVTSRAIRASGAVVTLSGEGADELFGGYDRVLRAFAAHGAMGDPPISASRFHLEVTAWNSPASLDGLLREGASDAVELVTATYEDVYQRSLAEGGPSACPLDAHLRSQRALNLTTLLERLDAATMRHGVEGRTPFADVDVMQFADSLPMATKFVEREDGTTSKRVLRDAFMQRLPEGVITRPKASFPMPFERWTAPVAGDLHRCRLLADVVRPEVVEAVRSAPEDHWKLSWLLSNLSLWLNALERGSSGALSDAA